MFLPSDRINNLTLANFFDSGGNFLGTANAVDVSGIGTVFFLGFETNGEQIKTIITDLNENQVLVGIDNFTSEIDPIPGADTCDVGGGPNDIRTVTASYDVAVDEIVVEMVLCADVDRKTRYQIYFDYRDTTNLDGDGLDDGPDTLDLNPDCVRTYDDIVVYRNGNARGPGTTDLSGNTLVFSVTIDDLDPSLELGDTVLIWTDTKAKNTTDKAPNTESGDGCEKPQVASEVITLTLD